MLAATPSVQASSAAELPSPSVVAGCMVPDPESKGAETGATPISNASLNEASNYEHTRRLLADITMIGARSSLAEPPAETARRLGLAAEKGSALAQSGLGLLFLTGTGVLKDPIEAERLFRLAAQQGDPGDQMSLADLYLYGNGIAQNVPEAMTWYEAAAKQGYSYAQDALGQIYAEGTYVSKDPVRAHMWFSVAATSLSRDYRIVAVKNLDHVASLMTAEEIAKAQEMARRCQATKFKECD